MLECNPACPEATAFPVNVERLQMWSAIEQCEANKPDGTDTAVVFKKNGKQPYIAIPLTVFCDMLQIQYETGEK